MTVPWREWLSSKRLLFVTVRCRISGKPDLRRWGNAGAFDPDWEHRLRRMAELVPDGSCVVDIGSGPVGIRQWLDPSVRWVPVDLVDRGEGGVVCDLNRRPFPSLAPYAPSVATIGGVLEYVNDVTAVVRWLSQHVSLCVVSYECATTRRRSLGRAREVGRRFRTGWVSTLDEWELRAVFLEEGFVEREVVTWQAVDGPARIFVFERVG